MSHVVLLGDSIFDNAGYVPGGPSVVEQLNKALPPGSLGTLLAVDGSVTDDIAVQLKRLPADATHLVVSSGGNDALGHAGLIRHESADSVREVLDRLGAIRDDFQAEYRAMLALTRSAGKPVVVATIYDAVPGLSRAEFTGLCLFNDAILREAARAGVPVIDLRLVCGEAADYSTPSPIEPSVAGGNKIARAIARVVASHDFAVGGCAVYG